MNSIATFVIAYVLLSGSAGAQAMERVVANVNRAVAGKVKSGVLELTLEIREGRWYPTADTAASVPIEAFAEAGKPVTNPGPLIRVREGTPIQVTVHNTLAKAAKVFGLETHPASAGEGVSVAAGESKKLRFNAGQPGTYYYWATTTDRTLEDRGDIDSQLNGAFIVDPRSASAPVNDRVFVLGLWFEEASKLNGVVKPEREVLVINGKSWP
jgi:FtsP/CotA-like multicopper oxidase with cupredoxin domain